MAKHIKGYNNVMFNHYSAEVVGRAGYLRAALVDSIGHLEIYESEHKNPGKKFVQFIANNGVSMKTSAGDLENKEDTIILRTHDGKNIYSFKILGDNYVQNKED